ncbi:glycosyltransferase family 4 protein [Devosia sp. Leaf64]|uniref:glycosyltransferase family 4 protein n=1 Tax=Devosia sp. Leaf64 TaxID=1736229 RepID=UPI000712E322|nr:glycosyltransferase family 4 protein [Devosia sp. Leaf64]KQN74827.1 glycosyl transferase family 1 [Devosia sp. Leaf64]
MTTSRPKLVFFVSVDWFFYSHFLERAMAARDAGYEVVVLTRIIDHGERIKAAGLRVIHLDLDRRSLNPLGGVKALFHVWRVFSYEKPALVHQVALKPILIGSLAAKFSGIPHIINAVVGTGYLFSSRSFTTRLLRPIAQIALKRLMNPRGSKVVFENNDDLSTFANGGYVRENDAVLIAGAGVRPDDYPAGGVFASPPLVVLVARLLWDKGIGEFVEAARRIKRAGISVRFAVIGDIDPGNRASIDEATLRDWRKEGHVEFWGFRTDIASVLQQAAIACLPSYREGLPKSLLEAMAASLPCVTTDVPGCRDAVRHCDNGLLVAPRDATSLQQALLKLICDPDLRAQMGKRGRARVETEFSSQQVIGQTLALYHRMIAGRG